MAVFLQKQFFFFLNWATIEIADLLLFQTRTRKEKSMAYKALAAQGLK
jgi:hypothetical protein